MAEMLRLILPKYTRAPSAWNLPGLKLFEIPKLGRVGFWSSLIMFISWRKAVVLLGFTVGRLVLAEDIITSDTTFYGQSPPVYPSPEGTGAGDWASAYQKAKAFVAKLSDDEKVNLTAGVSSENGCSGNIQGIPRLGFPGMCVSDAGNGLRGPDFVNSWSSGIHVGASWNRDLAKARAVYMGKEFRKKGVNMILGPVVGPIGRVTLGGRNWEGFAADPYLSGILAAESVKGLQSQNVATSLKNSKTLNGLLKTELGFQGYVISDWYAQHAGISSASAGLDVVMPSSSYWNSNLTTAITNGTMEASRLDDMITRLMATWYYLDQDSAFPSPGIGIPSSISAAHQAIIATSEAAKSVLLQSSIEGHVLVKNKNNALPLKPPELVSVFGYDAYTPMSYTLATSFSFPTTERSDLYHNGTLYSGGGSGANSPAYIDSPIEALQRRAYEDGSSILWDFTSENPTVNYVSDVCLVFINAYATEGADREALSDSHSDTIVTNVAKNCANTVVVVHNAGIRTIESWVDHANVTGVIFAHLPGQDTGRALLQSKALTMGLCLSHLSPKGNEYFPQSNFSEGVYIDYRAFDQSGIEPQYAFGYGLSYTTFGYSNLKVSKTSASLTSYPAKASILPGGNPRLFDTLVKISATVKNTGNVDGKEVAQLYVGIPGGPVRQLRGFEKVLIKSGKTTTVTFSLTRRDLSTWDTDAQEWLLQRGTYQIYVGRSSRDLPLTGTLTI
ncbi:Glycoside hydrolase, superfamily [Penicillium expansum]|nr:Glycoside hydrolase, superfamily [Penicillium expansum]